MLHFTEEIGANEDSRCSHQAIHTANRGRQQRTNQTRRVVRLQKENRENLPVLGHSCSATDSVKYEAIIAQHLQVQPAIRKIRLSQLLGQENGTISKAKNQMPTGRMSAQTLGKDHQTRRKRQFGYSRQKARLCAEEEVMRKFMSNYERVQHFGKLKDVVQDLRAQVIQSSGKLSLLASK